LMQDGKALQAGTSHFLGQNFAKAFDVKFSNKENKQEFVWGTSWGVSTRLMGALIMAHSDDEGLILPPNLAPIQVVIVPIYKGQEQFDAITEKVKTIKKELQKAGLSVKYDDRDSYKPGFKFAEWELKGVPIRLAIGQRDLENNTVEVARRDTKEKMSMSADNLAEQLLDLSKNIQENIYQRAFQFRESHITDVSTYQEFKEVLENKGGFVRAFWDGTPETEAKIKEETKATIRCIPLNNPQEEGKCMLTGNPAKEKVLFALAY
ncbi:MAG: proline--tRNA ligase, partial [Bacteroidetes bacterium]